MRGRGRVRVRLRVRLWLQLGLEVGGGIYLQPSTPAPAGWHVPWLVQPVQPVQPSSHAIAPQSAVDLVRVRA